MRIVLLGLPGTGKGTVAKLLTAQDGSVHLSTGDLLRAEVAAGSETGLAAARFMTRGELVPDRLFLEIVEQRIRACGDQGFILDGFPRTIPQAVSLDFILKRLGLGLDLVAELNVPVQVIMDRLTTRRTCSNLECQEIYNLKSNPPAAGDLCRKCGKPVIQRPDETDEAVANRLRVYREKSANLTGHYERKGLLLQVRELDSNAAVAQIMGAVAALGRSVVQ
jgi:adenylate kinase